MDTNPGKIVCEDHKRNRKEVLRLRNEVNCTFREIAPHTSNKQCESQIC